MWMVVESTPGYLPDSDEPAVFDSLRDAMAHAEILVEEIVDMFEGDCDVYEGVSRDVVGSDRSLYDRMFFRIETREGGMFGHSLGRVVEIIEMEDE